MNLTGERTAGVRAPAGPDVFERFVDYRRERLAADPHLSATALYDEIQQLGYDRFLTVVKRALDGGGTNEQIDESSL